jgi:hypothetical protein
LRGIIIYPEMRRMPGGGVRIVSSIVDPLTVRRAALYWDKIDHPTTRAIYVALSPDEERLKQAGVLTETRITDRFQTENILLEAPARALLQHNTAAPGQWALAQSSPDLVIPASLSIPTRGLEVELHEALPVPAEDVPIEDVLQFKHRRRDELLAFRSWMDELYLKAIDARDGGRAREAAVLELHNRLADVSRVVGEQPWRRVFTSLKIDLASTDVAMLGTLLHQPLAKIVGAVAASIKIGGAVMAGFKNPIPDLRDYAYLGYTMKELGAQRAPHRHAAARIATNDGQVTSLGGRSKIGRNDPCFCGSGKKFKKCHGANT